MKSQCNNSLAYSIAKIMSVHGFWHLLSRVCPKIKKIANRLINCHLGGLAYRTVLYHHNYLSNYILH